MKKSLDHNSLREALKHSSAMLCELKTSLLSPRNYFTLCIFPNLKLNSHDGVWRVRLLRKPLYWRTKERKENGWFIWISLACWKYHSSTIFINYSWVSICKDIGSTSQINIERSIRHGERCIITCKRFILKILPFEDDER